MTHSANRPDPDAPSPRVDRPGAGRKAGSWVEEPAVLSHSTRDDTDAGWGEERRSNDDRLWEERPPHWD